MTLDKYEEGSPEPIVNLLDNSSSSSSFIRSSQCDLRQSPSMDKRAPGLLWLLDDTSSLQPAGEHYFTDKVFSLYNDRGGEIFHVLMYLEFEETRCIDVILLFS